MYQHHYLKALPLVITLTISACSSNDDSTPINESTFNPDAPAAENTGVPGGDITAIAGLWDGTNVVDDISDVVYWNLASDGVLTRYDYQQDGVTTASGENCYIVDDRITVSPESGNDYSFFNVAITAVRTDDTLAITFNDADINDVDNDGDITETPIFNWTLLTTPVLADLNNCTATTEVSGAPIPGDQPTSADIIGASDGGIPTDSASEKPLMTRAECRTNGGTIVGDIGDGAIHQPEYRCESGLAPIARITYLEGEPIATEGEVCCV